MPHAIWKGAISFGLVYVPVALYPASEESGIDFDWLDKRTGKEMKSEDIVKGIKQDNGEYVILSEDEIREAYPNTQMSPWPPQAFIVSASRLLGSRLPGSMWLNVMAQL